MTASKALRQASHKAIAAGDRTSGTSAL
jgi:hypothetical protein